MMRNNNFYIPTYVRLHDVCSLIFFALTFFSACKQNPQSNIEIVWEDKRAVAISIPKNILGKSIVNSIENLKVFAGKNKSIAVLGEYKRVADRVVFRPLIPLSGGLDYHIYFDDKLIRNISVPLANVSEAQRLISVYPSIDTLPENLLKIYLQFSGPMREGEALKHIALLDQNSDTVPGIFLDLQPELWNIERTVLTLWLDPGRIKRDLLPNQQLGNPLMQGKRYTLAISKTWKDVQGLPLQQPFSKQFIVAQRDETSPAVEQWNVDLPNAQTSEPLTIKFNEPLDYFLLQESIVIVDNNNKNIDGRILVSHHERTLEFIPNNNWVAGPYRISVEPVLEDLAGNNLSRLFDRDVLVKNANATRTKFEISFKVR